MLDYNTYGTDTTRDRTDRDQTYVSAAIRNEAVRMHAQIQLERKLKVERIKWEIANGRYDLRTREVAQALAGAADDFF